MLSIAFCTTCKGRLKHLEQTLPQNLIDNAGYEKAKFIVLDYGDGPELSDYMWAKHRADIESGRVVYYQHCADGPFHMAHAKNMAHRLGIVEGCDVLCNLDADNYTGYGFAEYLDMVFETGPRNKYSGERESFCWSRMVHGQLARGISGRIAVDANAFFCAGGYDEKYNTYSPDDVDFRLRLTRMGLTPIEIDPNYLQAIRHGDKLRFREYRHAACASEDEIGGLQEADNTVVNYGRFGLGSTFRNYEYLWSCVPRYPTIVNLMPVPTRIFGIGMHKTATTSLSAALQQVVFTSAHWVHPQWAKLVWDQLEALGRSPAMEQYYAVSDLPINIRYAVLDKGYPGSKFILTVRREGEWLESVRRHWSYEHNPYRSWWDVSPFTQKIHRVVYGRTDFDAETFINRYRQHNAEVKEYFRNRPDDLLIMDMSNGAGWKELCGFLKQPVPSNPYPTEFQTKQIGEQQ